MKYKLTERGEQHTHFIIYKDEKGVTHDMTDSGDFYEALYNLLQREGYESGTAEYVAAARRFKDSMNSYTANEVIEFMNDGIFQWPLDFGYVEAIPSGRGRGGKR